MDVKELRRSERRKKKPTRYGQESTPEEELLETQIQRAQMELTLLRLKRKEEQLMRSTNRSPEAVVEVHVHAPASGNDDLGANGKSPAAGNVSEVAKDAVPPATKPVDAVNDIQKAAATDVVVAQEKEVKATMDGVASGSTDYTRFKTAFKHKTEMIKFDNLDEYSSHDSGSVYSEESRGSHKGSHRGYGESGESHIADAIREQSHNMNKFMSRQSLGRENFHFSGNYQEYQLFVRWFWDTTNSCQFSPQENINRLKNCLQGEARDAVRYLLYSPSCIEEIFRILDKRFGKPEFLIKTVIAEARELPPVKEEKPETVIKMSTVVLNMVASMKMLDMKHYLMNPQLLEDLLAKLPIAMRVRWSEYIADYPGYTLETFSRWMDRRAEAAGERIPFQLAKDNERKKSVVGVTNEVEVMSIEHDVKATPHVKVESHEVKLNPVTKCDFCGDQHELEKCESFESLPSGDERWNFVSEKKLCFFCLKGGHRAAKCKMKNKKCGVENCGQRHNTLLHRFNAAAIDPTPTHELQGNAIVPSQLPTAGQNVVGHTVVQQSRILMKILPVILCGPNGAVKTFAFLDEGSTLTLMKIDLANKLGLDGPTMSLRWHGTTHDMTSSSQARIVDVKIKGTFPGAKEYNLKRVRAIDNLTLPRQSVNVEDLVRDWRYLSQQHVESYENAEPEILIGLDNIAAISSLEVIHGPWNAPYLARTLLGWVILGNVNPHVDSFVERSCAMVETVHELHETVKQAFSLEYFRASPHEDTVRSRDDKKAIEIMERTTERTSDGSYERGLLRRIVDPIIVTESKQQALERLYSTGKRLDRNLDLAKANCEKMDDHIRMRYLVKMDDNAIQKTWCMPHLAVRHPVKKKIRIVFDCGAKARGVCLNDLLLTGSDMLKSLPEVLMNFGHKYGFMGDIRKVFHRVKVPAEDQNNQEILRREMNRDSESEEYKVPIMTLGVSSSPGVAAYVKNLNSNTFMDEYPVAMKDILKHTNCDSFVSCADAVKKVRQCVGENIWRQKFDWNRQIWGELMENWRKFPTELYGIEKDLENLIDLNFWQWVLSKNKATDLVTRMISCDFSNNSMCLVEHKFLKKPKDKCPNKSHIDNSLMDDSEMMKHFITVQHEKGRVILHEKGCKFSNWMVDDLEHAEATNWKNIQEFGYDGELRQLESEEIRPRAFDDMDLRLRKSCRMSQVISEMFWRREYLSELAGRTKWYNDVPKLEVGSVVVIADETLPRNNWPLGIVEATYPGKDKNIRSALVRTARGIYKRPVAKICVLDVGATAPRGENVIDG